MNEFFNVLVATIGGIIIGMVFHSSLCHSYPEFCTKLHQWGVKFVDRLKGKRNG